MLTPLLIIGLGIVVIEWILWTIFRSKVRGMSFSRDSNESFFRFFTVARLASCALLHTALLLAILILSMLWLW